MFRRPVRDDLGAVAGAVEWADAVAAAQGLDAEVRYAVQLCLEEALANLVLHGRAAGPDKAILVELLPRPPGATVIVSDACAPFNPLAAALPPPDPADPRIGGLGLGLIAAFTQDRRYDRVGDRNQLTLSFGP